MNSSIIRIGFFSGVSLSLLCGPQVARADYVWLGKITGESDLGKRYSVYNGDSASLYVEANWEDTTNPGNPAPPDSVNNSSQPIAGIKAPLIVNNGGVTGGTNGAGSSTAHLRTNGHALTVTGPGSGMKMTVDGQRAMIQNDGIPGDSRSPLTISDGAFVLTQQLQDIEVTLSGTDSRLFIGTNNATHAGLENSTIAVTGADGSSPEIHFINNVIENVLLALPSITINGSPAVAGSDPFSIEPGDNVIFSPRADYSFANFKQLDGQQGGSTSGVSMRAITPVTPLLYWDINGSEPGAGGEAPDGVWNAANTNWSASAAGNTATAAWTDGSVASFSAGSDATGLYSVNLATARTLSGLLVESGDLDLTGGNLDFSSGSLQISNLAFLTLTSQVVGGPASLIEAGSTLLLNADQTLGGLNGYGAVFCDQVNLVTRHEDVARFAGSLQSSTGSITKAGNGELRLTRASHTIDGDLILEAGKLTLAKDQGNQGGLASAPLIWIKTGATLDASAAPLTLSSSQELTGAGTLAIANRTTWSQPAGNNFAAQVAIVADALTVSGIISPGDDGIGELTVTEGNVNLLDRSLLIFQIDDSAAPKSDKLTLGGVLKIQPGSALEFDITGTPDADFYELIRYTGAAPTGTFTVEDLPAGYRLDHAYNGNSVALVKSTSFDGWASANGIPGAAFDADGPDNDGIPNGVEYALGLDPATFDTLPLLAATAGDFTWTLPKGAAAAADPGIGYFFETSDDLSAWNKVSPTSQDATSFSILLGGGVGPKFVRVVIGQQ